MYGPPPSYEDMLADAEESIYSSPYAELDVPVVGTIQARRPLPDAVALLAMAANPEGSDQDRLSYLVRFCEHHLAAGEMERLYFGMMVDQLPANTLEHVIRALTTWGTSRPYVAVVSLAVMASYHWRSMRNTFALAGIADPMSLSSMHVILDVMEASAVENILKCEDAEAELASFYRRLYGPTPDMAPGDLNRPVPVGFSPEEVEASFDAFARAAR